MTPERYNELTRKAWSEQVREVQSLLTAAGVPEFVTVENCPGNSAPHRLKWFLARRKDVSAEERTIDDLNELNAPNT